MTTKPKIMTVKEFLEKIQDAAKLNPDAKVHIAVCDPKAGNNEFYSVFLGFGFRNVDGDNENFEIVVLNQCSSFPS